jgi:hypothetical protein
MATGKVKVAETALPGCYLSLLEIQEDFVIGPDPSRLLLAVTEECLKPEALRRVTEEISRMTPMELESRMALLAPWLEGIAEPERHLLSVFERHFPPDSPLCHCSAGVKAAAAAALVRVVAYEGIGCRNPAIVPHPDQASAPEGSLRVILSLEGCGEGLHSFLSFRTGGSRWSLGRKRPAGARSLAFRTRSPVGSPSRRT